MSADAVEQLEVFRLQRDAWSGPGGRWVKPPGWRPTRDDEVVRVRWFRHDLTWSLEGRWEHVRATLTRLGVPA